MRSLTLSQWRDFRMGVICEDLGALTTAGSVVRDKPAPASTSIHWNAD